MQILFAFLRVCVTFVLEKFSGENSTLMQYPYDWFRASGI